MEVVALNDRVIVVRVEEDELTEGGLYRPDSAKEKPQAGIVKSVGEKVIGIEVGQRVYFGKYSGTEIKVDEVLLVLNQEEILCKVK